MKAAPPSLEDRAPAVSLEKATVECYKRDPLEDESCVRGVWFRNVRNGELAPFRCGSCPECLRSWSRRARRGFYRAVLALGLSALLTLTLPADLHRPETFQDAIRARGEIWARWNRFRTFLRKRGFMGEYLAVVEAHADGTPHLHVAFNDSALVAAFGYDYRAVQAFLQESWTRAGGGFLWWKRGRGNPWAAAAELSKYVGKAIAGGTGKASPPWTRARWCTVETGFRRKPFRRWWGSRDVAEMVRGSVRGPFGRSSDKWALVAQVHGRPVPQDPRDVAGSLAAYERHLGIRYVPWSPGRSVAIVPECDAHDPSPWEPFLCHHERPERSLGCWCRPPWLDEPPGPSAHRIVELIARFFRGVPLDIAGVDLCHPHECFEGCAEHVLPISQGPAAANGPHELGYADRAQPDGGPTLPIVTMADGPATIAWTCACVLCRTVGGGTCSACPRCRRAGAGTNISGGSR